MSDSIYDFSARTITGEELSLDRYRGQVLLVVNTASKCGFTPQYDGLEALHQKYRDQGLVVLGFPSNQFANQEPGSAEDIESFCRLNHGVTFQLFDKISVNGADAHPLFEYLKEQQPGLLGSRAIKWNFTKFLVGRDGRVLERIAPATTPESLVPKIEALLKA